MIVACSEGDAETALAMLNGTISYEVTAVETEGSSALWVAAAEGHTELVSALLNLGSDTNRPNNYNRTPLMAAAFMGHADTCKVCVLEYLFSSLPSNALS
jgi:ankyrin repeat protein